MGGLMAQKTDVELRYERGDASADQIQEVAAATFRADNRVVLTYLPELPTAETDAIDADPASEPSDAAAGEEAADDEEVAA